MHSFPIPQFRPGCPAAFPDAAAMARRTCPCGHCRPASLTAVKAGWGCTQVSQQWDKAGATSRSTLDRQWMNCGGCTSVFAVAMGKDGALWDHVCMGIQTVVFRCRTKRSSSHKAAARTYKLDSAASGSFQNISLPFVRWMSCSTTDSIHSGPSGPASLVLACRR